jgi:hypothetical protein
MLGPFAPLRLLPTLNFAPTLIDEVLFLATSRLGTAGRAVDAICVEGDDRTLAFPARFRELAPDLRRSSLARSCDKESSAVLATLPQLLPLAEGTKAPSTIAILGWVSAVVCTVEDFWVTADLESPRDF